MPLISRTGFSKHTTQDTAPNNATSSEETGGAGSGVSRSAKEASGARNHATSASSSSSSSSSPSLKGIMAKPGGGGIQVLKRK